MWLEINRQYASVWPNVTQKKPPLADADAMNGTSGKHEAFFSSNPGTGD
jgi:ferredoxin